MEFIIKTEERYQLINITERVKEEVKKNNIDSGAVLVFTFHTTAAILVTENEPGLESDWLSFFKKIVAGFDFKHNKIDSNGDSHLLAGLLGAAKTFLIEDKNLVLGTWQNIFLVEFDGPRERKVVIKIL